MRVSFAKTQRQFSPIMVNGKELEIVPKAKLLGLTISGNLTWNVHVRDVIKKASKRIYFLIQLKRANDSHDDLKLFYITCIRSIPDYAILVFHYFLPKYLMNEMERIQKRIMVVIFPDFEYSPALERLCIDHLDCTVHHTTLCQSLFKSISNNENRLLHCLSPPSYDSQYNLRQTLKFLVSNFKTNLCKNSFIHFSCYDTNCNTLSD